MRAARRQWTVLGVVFLCLAVVEARAADGEEGTGDLRRDTPSGQYIDPASYFRFHGYISLSYTEADDALGAALEGTPHILVSGPGPSGRTGRNEGGFRNDAALFVGGEPFEGVGGVIEIHFVGNALDPVITEAKMTWDLVGSPESERTFRLVAGRFWWPFGIHNGEWFSAINRFSLLSPAATEVVPAHYNEVGIMGEGELRLQQGLGLNYVLAVGNGVPGFGLMGNVVNTGADSDGNRTLTGRVGLVALGSDLKAELGLSAASGRLRSREDGGKGAGDAERYAAEFTALGPDFSLHWKGLGLRSYFYASSEDLSGAPLSKLERTGMTVEPAYTIERQAERFKAISLVGRYSMAEEETLAGTTLKRTQWGIGLTADITSSFKGRVGFVAQGEEEDLPELDDNALSVSLTNEF